MRKTNELSQFERDLLESVRQTKGGEHARVHTPEQIQARHRAGGGMATWQKLNVTAFLMSGITSASPEIMGEPYRDAADNAYHSLCIQPIIVLSANQDTLKTIHQRALERKVPHGLYIEG